ncbi:MAG: carboxypeptidase regulatory-like domain-containing protein, partial [Myxococcales bacterium]|nr:carboxypeptidase regulatory-like domain-containing protein [Myxococcales bacterium]
MSPPKALAGLLTALALAAAPGCDESPEPFARAYRATSPDQLIGGDLAMAQVGDFILENDRVRIAVLDKESSPAPGVFGGTLVDADLQRPEAQFRGGRGHDQLAEVFPVANLFFPRPGTGDIAIVSDGSDGGAAIVRVSGDGGLFLEALSILQDPLVAALFAGVKVDLRFTTDYILEPGKRYVRMATTVTWTSAPTPSDAVKPLPVLTGPTSIFGVLLGDADNGVQPGVMAGDFVFFGGHNDLFAPGIGFDEEKPVFDALYANRDTFTQPLAFDYMAAAGGEVSYGYFNGPPAEGGEPQVLVPLITSSSTGFVTHALACSTDSDDDATCDAFTTWTYERFLAVGDGDIASVADVVYAARGTVVGTLEGVVRGATGAPLPNARVFVLRDPDAARTFASVNEVVDQNLRDVGNPGVLNAIDADVGRDPVEDGDFHATMPPGTYLVVAQNEAQTSSSPPVRVTVTAGERAVVSPAVPRPGRIAYHLTDGGGHQIEAKLSLVPVLADGTLAERDGLRLPALGQGRLGNGLRYRASTLTGDGVVEVEPGTYRVVATHGPEYGDVDVRVTVAAGEEVRVSGVLRHEVDTEGFVAGDFHLHARASFDSG